MQLTPWTTITNINGWTQVVGPGARPYPYDISDPVIINHPGIDFNYLEEDLPKNKLPEGVEMKNLYEVYMIYAENRKKPEVYKETMIIANNEEDAKIKSGLLKEVDKEWDNDYLTFICKNIGEVKVKEKAKEVKNV